jgi:peptidoglycan/xylan/chitin deacetylase (PgdA/CDA1 family)
MLDLHGLTGTFYIPIRNSEGHAVMSATAMRDIGQHFEIGSHTLDHKYLPGLPIMECKRQINEGKLQLEGILGHKVDGFCYPGGKQNTAIQQMVKDAGFTYARGVDNFWLNCGTDRFNVPTTIQFYPHPRHVLWRNFVRRGNYIERSRAFACVAGATDWLYSLKRLADSYAETDSVVHIWGHSWEIEKNNLWSPLNELLKHVSQLKPRICRVDEFF